MKKLYLVIPLQFFLVAIHTRLLSLNGHKNRLKNEISRALQLFFTKKMHDNIIKVIVLEIRGQYYPFSLLPVLHICTKKVYKVRTPGPVNLEVAHIAAVQGTFRMVTQFQHIWPGI